MNVQNEVVEDELGTAGDDLSRLRDSLTAHRLVNLIGPLGSGKSRLLTDLAPDVLVDLTAPGAPERLRSALRRRAEVVGVDGLDGVAALVQVRRILATHWCADTSHVVLASRLAVAGRPGWDDEPPAVVEVAPWPDGRIDALAARHTLGGPGERRFVAGLAGGNPLVATCLITALHRGAPITRSAAVADHAADVIVTRLGTERPGPGWRRILRVLASVGFGDQELLDVDEKEFTTIAGLSIVDRAGLGLAVREPYRTVLDLSYRWRRPLEYRSTLTRAGVHRVRMLSETSDHELRKDLTVHGLFLTDEPHVRAMLFPPRPSLPTITVAREDDVDDLARMIRAWALDSDFDTRATDRMTDRWLGGSPEHFHVTRNAEGRPTALAHLVPFSDAVTGGVEPVAQQFTERFAAETDGTFVITGYWPDESTGAAMLRRIVEEGVDRGHMVVCTPKPEYQRLARAMALPHVGTARHETFGAGHATHVFGQRMAPGDLPTWVSRLAALTGRRQPPEFLSEQLVHALESFRTPARLVRSPLLAAPHTDTPDALRDWLARHIEELAGSDDQREAEAGALLLRHYLGGAPEPRPLILGLAALTERFRAEGTTTRAPRTTPVEPPGPANPGSLDEFTAQLRTLRTWAGNPSYAEITRRIDRLRAARGQPGGVSRITVYDCFRTGRRRLDIDLVTDIVHALGGTDHDTRRWRRRYGAITDETS